MINKFKETISNLPGKSGIILMMGVFLVAIFMSRWIQFQSETIEDTMVLHHERELTLEEKKLVNIYKKEMKKNLNCEYNLRMPMK